VPLQTALELPAFQGPLDLLLDLVERRRLEITEVSLATVADQYLQAVRALAEPDPDLLGEFLVIGARLLLLKSRALLPRTATCDDEEPLDDLAERLEEYRRFKEVAHLLASRVGDGEQAFTHGPRPSLLEHQPPLAQVEAAALARLWRSISRRQTTAKVDPESFPSRVSVGERLTFLRRILLRRRRFGWSEVAGQTLDEVIATFLAVLELVRRSELVISQDRCFGPIELAVGSATVALHGEGLGNEPQELG
jgi:segregation and condensation protein A